MNSDFGQALILSAFGIGTTFAALGVLVMLMILLQRIFPVKSEPVEESEMPEIHVDGQDGVPSEQVAAIAAVWWVLTQQQTADLGKRLEQPRGRWWQRQD
jgi:Na+-transporting methylmalonyl-CoA/oxaloacetate decarboxylase gamma subunit